MYDEADYIMLSALQHYLYCPRQCALIHLEQVWAENRFTAEGRVLHERADSKETVQQGRMRTVRTLLIRSARLGIARAGRRRRVPRRRRVYPVEYKRGRPKANRCDEVQLCAQALCLEEMLGVQIESGALFYGEKRRRKAVAFDARDQGADRNDDWPGSRPAGGQSDAAGGIRKKCEQCSLRAACLPQSCTAGRSVRKYLAGMLRGIDEKDAEYALCDDPGSVPE